MRGPAFWAFARMGHEVYTRPADVDRWEFGRKGSIMSPYIQDVDEEGQRQYPATEFLYTEMAGTPSVRTYQTADTHNTVQSVNLHSKFAALLDLDPIRALATRWFELLKSMSMGPLTTGDLRRLNHPYGYGAGTTLRGWERLKHPNKVPTQPKRQFKGVRGSVANLDIVNYNTGKFYRGWRMGVLPNAGGVTLNFWNEAKAAKSGAPYPWFLFHGSIYSQAHGPWNRVARELLPAVMRVWRQVTFQAYRRAIAEKAAMMEATG
jgi:hypothetical protein